jgi:hypothetical protein
MKKLCVLSLTLAILSFNGKAQTNENTGLSRNNLHLEFGTNVIVSSVSLNLERYFASSKSGETNFYGRAGFGYGVVFWGHYGWGALGGVTILTNSSGNGHFEGSGGLFLGYEPGSPSDIYPATPFLLPLVDLGFRYQKPGNSFIFRVKAGTLGAGISLGFGF